MASVPFPVLGLVALLIATFAALVGVQIQRWVMRGRENSLRELQRQLNQAADGPGWQPTSSAQVFVEPVTQQPVVAQPRW